MTQPNDVSELCLACGLCCDGTLFGDVELQSKDDANLLKSLGLKIRSRGRPRFTQPCLALGSDCHCRIYGNRPTQCRSFECALLQSVLREQKSRAVALRIIRKTRQQADRIRQLLRILGDMHEDHSMAKRFQTVRRRMESPDTDSVLNWDQQLETFADLTMAVHDLQFTLRREFYPDPSDVPE